MSYFLPSVERAAELRRAMDASLLESICVVVEEVRPGGQLVPAMDGAVLPDTSALDYGAYFDLALPVAPEIERPASVADDAVGHLLSRLTESGALGRAQDEIPVTTLAEPYFAPAQVERLIRWWDAETQNAFGLKPISDGELGRAREWIATSFEMLRRSLPELHGEIHALVRDIVVARPDGVRRTAFGAASSFALWGSFVVDYTSNDTWPQMYRTIVHEAAHNLLFALARSEPLVGNDPDERFPSPVRSDLRPMDGIYHAAFVSARESLALDRLLSWNEKSNALGAGDAEFIFRLLEVSVLNFQDCARTLQSEGKLTGLGAAVLSECQAFMDESFAFSPI